MERIKTPRGNFKVAARFESDMEAHAAGYGNYFGFKDGDKYYHIYTKTNTETWSTSFGVRVEEA